MKISRLDNGLTYAVHPMDVSYVSIVASVGLGSLYESKKESAHLLEHLVFEGTKTRDYREILDEFDSSTVNNNYNAQTYPDKILFMSFGAKNKADKMMGIISDIIQNPTFTRDRMDMEKEAVRRELASASDGLTTELVSAMYGKMFRNSDLDNALRIASDDEIASLTREDILKEHDYFFRPDNVAVVIYGGINTIKGKGIVHENFSDFSGRFRGIRKPVIKPTYDTSDEIVKSKMVSGPTLAFGFPIPEYRSDNREERVALEVVADLLNKRFMDALRHKNGYVYDVSADTTNYAQFGSLLVATECSHENMDRVKEEVSKQISLMHGGEIDGVELEKILYSSRDEQNVALYTQPVPAAMTIASAYIYTKDAKYTKSLDKDLDINIDIVREVSEKYLNPDRMSKVSLLPK